MNRRQFVAASAATVATAGPLAAGAEAQQQGGREYLELRRYHTLAGSKQRDLHAFLGEVAVPAMKRAGIGPVGAFNVVYGENAPSIYLLMPHRTIESVATLRQRLADDAEYTRAGKAFLEAPLSSPGYVRIDSSLMRTFSGMPKLEAPATDRARIFELRRYESHSDRAAVRKIEMFDRGGEIAIFRKVGLTPVFFGEAIVGPHLPNLTYMLTFPDMAARDAAWDRFREDPDWKKLAPDPYYAETVSAISDTILRPTPYSQI